MISYLRNFQPLANLLVTSRGLGNIEMMFEGDPKLRIVPPDKDLYLYVQDRMETLSKDARFKRRILDKDPSLRESIPKAVVEKAAGMFLLAQLHMDEITSKSTLGAVRNALVSLPHDINATYDQAMERIRKLPEDDRIIALKTLSWIYVTSNQRRQPKKANTSAQHLSVIRLAVGIRAQEETFDEDFVPDREDITSFCAGLVIIDELDMVTFVHYSAQEYFNKSASTFPLFTQVDITLDCIAFIKQYCRSNAPLLEGCGQDDGKPIYPLYFDPAFWSSDELGDGHEHHRLQIEQTPQGTLAAYVIQTWDHHVNEEIRGSDPFRRDPGLPKELSEVETKVRKAFVAALREPTVARHWRTLSRYPAPTIFPPDEYEGFEYKYSACWKDYGITSILIAAGLEKAWAVMDMLDQDPNIKAMLVYSRMNGGIRAHFTSQAETRLKAKAQGKLLLGLKIPDSNYGPIPRIWASR